MNREFFDSKNEHMCYNQTIKQRKKGMLMLRGQKVFFRASKVNLDRLYACNRESARVWNECLRLAKEHFLQHGRWITKSELQKQTKRKFHLHSQSIQSVCHKYLFARTSHTKPSSKDILLVIPTRKRNTSQRNG
jgi:hypothetical protein